MMLEELRGLAAWRADAARGGGLRLCLALLGRCAACQSTRRYGLRRLQEHVCGAELHEASGASRLAGTGPDHRWAKHSQQGATDGRA